MNNRLRFSSILASVSLLATALLLRAPWAFAQTEDLAPPQLVDLTFTPLAIDVSGSDQSVTVTLHAKDDLSGVQQGYVYFSSPSGGQSHGGYFYGAYRISGDSLDGVYQFTIVFPRYSEGGTWTINQVQLNDVVGNWSYYYASDLGALGISVDLSVVGGADVLPPVLVDEGFTPSPINVSSTDQNVTVTVHATDDLAGVQQGYVYFFSPSGNQTRGGYFYSANRISGDPLDGTYQLTISFQRDSEGGSWRLGQLQIGDMAGNWKYYYTNDLTALGVPVNLSVQSDTPDTTGPLVHGVTVTPSAIEVSGADQSVTMSMHVSDDISGVQQGYAYYYSPSNRQTRSGYFYSGSRISGDALDGTYQFTIFFPRYSEGGTWRLGQVQTNDVVGNWHYYSATDLASLGFAAPLVVSCAGLTNPVISATGGTNPSCAGQPITLDAGPGYGSYVWSTGETTESITVSPTVSSIYTVTVTGSGCSASAVWTQAIDAIPTAVASGSTAISLGQSAPLSGGGAASCSWSPASGLSDPNSCNPIASPSNTTTYTLTVYTAAGCASTNAPSVTVSVGPPTNVPTTTTLSTNRNPALTTQPAVFTVTVAPVPPTAGVPTGEVEFFADGVSLGRSPVFLKNGSYVAVRGSAPLLPGAHTIAAQYSGDPTFAASSSSNVGLVVSPGTYFAIDLGTLGGNYSEAHGINSSGQVTGMGVLSSGLGHAFLYSSGSMQDLGTLDGWASKGYAINDAGEVTGRISGNLSYAFLYDGTTMMGIPTFGYYSEGDAINAAGQVAGQASLTSGNGPYHGFLYSQGNTTDIGALGGSSISVFGMNDGGQIVGSSLIAGNAANHAFLYASGSMSDLGTLGGTSSYGSFVNAAGEAAGYANLPGDATSHAFLYAGGAMSDLGTLGGSFSSSGGLNAAGQVTGNAYLPGDSGYHAFMYSGAAMVDLGTLGGSTGYGAAINDAGQVAGADTVGGVRHAFAYTAGALVDLGTLGGATSSVVAMNNSGQIVGQADRADGEQHAVLWQPVPISTIAVTPLSATTMSAVTLSASLNSFSTPVIGKTVSFSLGGGQVGSAITGSDGVATLPNVALNLPPGAYPGDLLASFAGDATLGASTGTADLTVTCGAPTAQASGSTTILPGQETLITGSGAVTCQWAPATDLDDALACSTYAHPSATTTYSLVVMDAFGCISTNPATVTIVVQPPSQTTTTVATSSASALTSAPPVFTATVAVSNGGAQPAPPAAPPATPPSGVIYSPKTAAPATPAAVPTGLVEFFADGVSLGKSPVFQKEGSYIAIRGGATLAVGTHSITAQYFGDTNFDPSSSAAVSQTINPGTYFAVDLGALPGAAPGARSTAARINAIGQISGASQASDGTYHAFVISSGVMTDLGNLGGDAAANSVNDAGALVGYACQPGCATYSAVQFSGGSILDLGSLGGSRSDANAINDAGQIVGYSYESTDPTTARAVLFGSGTPTILFDAQRGSANGINDQGDIVGNGDTSPNVQRAFLYTGGAAQFLDMGSGNGSRSAAYGVNEAQQISGYVYRSGDVAYDAAFWDGGVLTDIGNFGGPVGVASAVGDDGLVVGYSTQSGASDFRAFVYSGSGLMPLNTLGGSVAAAYGINASGQIVGESNVAGDTASHAALWQPVPVSSLAVAPTTGVVGGNVTLSATLMSQGAPVAGKAVSFVVTGSVIGYGITDGAGIASAGGISIANFTAGSYSGAVQASFPGDVTLGASSASGDLTIAPAPTTTTLTVDFTSAAQGQTVKLTGTVSPAYSGSPTGVLTFKDASTVLATIGIDGPPFVVFPTSSLALGSHSLSVSYAGDSNFQPSVSNTVIVTIVAKPDYRVTALSATGPVGAGQPITVTDTTKNFAGGTVTPGVPTAFFLSLDTTLDASDVLLGARAVPPLASGATSAASTTLIIPTGTAPNTYYIIAKADGNGPILGNGDVPETLENNNTRASAAIKIGPDLSVTALTVPASGGAGYPIAINDTTNNAAGMSPAPASSTSYYLSTDTTLDLSDVLLGSRSVAALAPGASDSGPILNLVIPAGTATGTYRVIAKADGPNAIFETNENNNTKVSGAIKIGPDLTVSSVVAPTSSGAGLTMAVTDTTSNGGGGDAASSTTSVYLSTDNVFDPSDILIGSRSPGVIAAGGSSTAATNVTIPAGTAAGSYYLIAVADSGNVVPETSETNNTRSKAISIGPDLTISSITAPTSGTHGATISVTVKTKNQGGGPTSVATSSNVYLSTTTSPSGAVMATRTVAAGLGVGSIDTSPALSVTLPSTPGSYYIVVVSDDGNVQLEYNETNNVTTKAITVN